MLAPSVILGLYLRMLTGQTVLVGWAVGPELGPVQGTGVCLAFFVPSPTPLIVWMSQLSMDRGSRQVRRPEPSDK
jgi:hypothetical protein